jgi:acyl carrier protein
MKDNAIQRERLYSIIRSVFTQPNLNISELSTAADVKGWDSFNHMNLIMRIEEEFGITFKTEEIGRMGSVGALLEAISIKSGLVFE